MPKTREAMGTTRIYPDPILDNVPIKVMKPGKASEMLSKGYTAKAAPKPDTKAAASLVSEGKRGAVKPFKPKGRKSK